MPHTIANAWEYHEFQSLKRDRGGSCSIAHLARLEVNESFNPSNGIGVVHAVQATNEIVYSMMFQSLKRDRGGSCFSDQPVSVSI